MNQHGRSHRGRGVRRSSGQFHLCLAQFLGEPKKRIGDRRVGSWRRRRNFRRSDRNRHGLSDGNRFRDFLWLRDFLRFGYGREVRDRWRFLRHGWRFRNGCLHRGFFSDREFRAGLGLFGLRRRGEGRLGNRGFRRDLLRNGCLHGRFFNDGEFEDGRGLFGLRPRCEGRLANRGFRSDRLRSGRYDWLSNRLSSGLFNDQWLRRGSLEYVFSSRHIRWRFGNGSLDLRRLYGAGRDRFRNCFHRRFGHIKLGDLRQFNSLCHFGSFRLWFRN